MKTNTDNPQYTENLARYLSGEMNSKEKLAFEATLPDTDETDDSLTEIKNQWLALESYKEPQKPDTQRAWNKIHTRLQDEKLFPLQTTAKSPIQRSRFSLIAAIAVLLLGVGSILYLTIVRRPALQLVHINTVNETNTRITTLADGSIIYIAQNSLFSFPVEFEPESRNVILKGEAFFDITPDIKKPFVIETDEAFIEVLGTTFNVKTQNGSSFELFVDRGKVKVTLKNNHSESQFVNAGEKIKAVKNNLIKSKYLANNSSVWYRQRMHFKDETLQQILNVLNRNFNTTFAVAEKETGDRRLTVTFENETASTMAELLCVALNLKSQTINGSVVLSEKKELAKPD